MSITKRAEIDLIGFDVGNDPVGQGRMEIRWRKMIYEGDRLLATDYHRAAIDVDTDLDATLEAVAQDIEQQGYTRPPQSDRGYIDDMCKRAWTPEVRAAVAADRAEKRRRAQEEETAIAAENKRLQEEREAKEAERTAKAAKALLKEAGVDLDAIKAERDAKVAGGEKA